MQSATPRVSAIPSRQLASVAGRAVASALLRSSAVAPAHASASAALSRRTPFSCMRAVFSTSSGDASAAAVRLPVTALSESETELRESVAAFAKKVIAPKVREMDAASKLDAGVLKALFEQGASCSLMTHPCHALIMRLQNMKQ
jgi:hypothetical protein